MKSAQIRTASQRIGRPDLQVVRSKVEPEVRVVTSTPDEHGPYDLDNRDDLSWFNRKSTKVMAGLAFALTSVVVFNHMTHDKPLTKEEFHTDVMKRVAEDDGEIVQVTEAAPNGKALARGATDDEGRPVNEQDVASYLNEQGANPEDGTLVLNQRPELPKGVHVPGSEVQLPAEPGGRPPSDQQQE